MDGRRDAIVVDIDQLGRNTGECCKSSQRQRWIRNACQARLPDQQLFLVVQIQQVTVSGGRGVGSPGVQGFLLGPLTA